MNENKISAAEEAAREAARRDSGQFGERTHEKPDCGGMVAADVASTGTISEDRFDSEYNPLVNAAGEIRFTADAAAKYPTTQVWTLCEGDRDGEELAIAGFDESTPGSMYTITEKPWDYKNQTAVFVTAEQDRPETATQLGEDEFDEEYQPIESPDSNTFRLEDTLNTPVNQVWTLVDGDETNHVYAVPGYCKVDRTRRAPHEYIITEKPWTDENARHIFWNMDDEANQDG